MAIALYRPALAADDRVGVNSAVNQAGTGTPPNAPRRELVIGQDIVFRERINTEAKGQTQIVFLDESSMSVGPNSDLTIDEFVYDPRTDTGKMAFNATRGVFRFVGGKISKGEDAVTVQTPVGSLGIRGGAFLLRLNGNQLEVVFIYGKSLTVTGHNGQHTQTVKRPGYAVYINGVNGDPSEPYIATAGLLQGLNAELDGRIGGSGGAREIPTDGRIAVTGVGVHLFYYYVEPDGTLVPCRTAHTACLALPDPGGIQTAAQVNTATADSAPVTRVATSTPTPTPTPARTLTLSPTPTPTSTPTPTPTPTSTPTPTPTPTPYAGSFNSTASPSLAGFPSIPTPFAGGSLQSGVFTAPVGSGTVTISPLTAGTQTAVTGQTPQGPVTGTAFLSSDSTFFFADLNTTSGPPQIMLLQGGIPLTSAATTIGTPNQVLAFNVQQDPALGSAIPFIRSATGGSLTGANISPLFLVTPSGTLVQDPTGQTTARTLQASVAVIGSGATQQTVVVASIGLAAGTTPQLVAALRGTSLMSATGTPVLINSAFGSLGDGVGGGFYGSSGLTGVALGANSSFASETPLSGAPTTYNFNHPATATTTPSGVGPGLGTNPSANFIPSSGFFGGTMNSTATPGAPYPITGTAAFTQTGPATFSANFTSDALPISSVSTGGLTALALTFGGNADGTPSSTIIDGNIYGAVEGAGGATLNGTQPGNQQLYLLSAAAAPLPGSLLPGGTLCSTCTFTQWGYWGGDVASNFAGNRLDRGHLNFWVAGQLIPSVNLPFIGVATFNGSLVGAVTNNGAQYTATGTFTNSFDFGASGCGSSPGCGTFTINTFDGLGPITGAAIGRAGSTFSGAIGASGINGQVKGGFFGPASPGLPPETGGSFSLDAPAIPYQAAGVFAGHR